VYKEHLTLLKRLHLGADLALIVLAFFASAEVASLLGRSPVPFERGLWIAPAVALVWLFFLDANGLYYTYRTIRRRDLAKGIAQSLLQGALVFAAILFVARLDVSRFQLGVFTGLSFVLLLAERLLVRASLTRIRERGLNYNSLLVVGTGRPGYELVHALRRNSHWGIRVTGALGTEPAAVGASFEGVPILGSIDDFESILAANPIDEVAIAFPEISADRLGAVLSACEREGVKARVVTDLYRPTTARAVIEELDGLPMVTFAIGPGVGWQLLCKEMFDRVGAAILLVLLAPLLGLIAVAIQLESRGPVLFVQERLGLRKRPFRLYKFRTMVLDAESRRAALEALNEGAYPAFKIRQDPRVTRVGRWLRRLSLDELPQIWNVLRGEMSFIGPRPPLPSEVVLYEDWQRRRLSMKPGISGLWQVAGRGRELDFSEWVRLDLEYIDNWSLALDVRIALLTIPTVLLGRGSV
jgi:exopolysaccharide biosynthesis polyprenyl glycosylphosphotransferase